MSAAAPLVQESTNVRGKGPFLLLTFLLGQQKKSKLIKTLKVVNSLDEK